MFSLPTLYCGGAPSLLDPEESTMVRVQILADHKAPNGRVPIVQYRAETALKLPSPLLHPLSTLSSITAILCFSTSNPPS